MVIAVDDEHCVGAVVGDATGDDEGVALPSAVADGATDRVAEPVRSAERVSLGVFDNGPVCEGESDADALIVGSREEEPVALVLAVTLGDTVKVGVLLPVELAHSDRADEAVAHALGDAEIDPVGQPDVDRVADGLLVPERLRPALRVTDDDDVWDNDTETLGVAVPDAVHVICPVRDGVCDELEVSVALTHVVDVTDGEREIDVVAEAERELRDDGVDRGVNDSDAVGLDWAEYAADREAPVVVVALDVATALDVAFDDMDGEKGCEKRGESDESAEVAALRVAKIVTVSI